MLAAVLVPALVAVLAVTTVPTAALPGAVTTAPTTAASSLRDDPDRVDLPHRCTDDDGYPAIGLCRLLPRKPGAPTVVLWGDSHAWQVIPALRAAAADRRVNLVSWVLGGCPPMLARRIQPGSPSTNGCDVHGVRVLDWLRAKKERGERFRLVVGTSWELYHDVVTPRDDLDRRYPGTSTEWVKQNAWKSRGAMPRLFRTLGRLAIPTDVVGQMPMVYAGEPDCELGAFQCDLPRVGTLKDARANNARIRELRGHLARGGRLVRPARTLCTTTVCRGRLGGTPVYFDRLHVGQRASEQLADLFVPTVVAAASMR